MKVALIYVHVAGQIDPTSPPPEHYAKYHQRFVNTYRRFRPTIPHELIVVFSGAEGKDADKALYNGLNPIWDVYTGPGWDIGAEQSASRKSDADAVMCFASPVYFWKGGWLEPFVKTFEMYGRGLLGAMASYENTPHIRTSSYMFSPKMMRRYPHLIDSREKCFRFESGFTSTGEMHASASWSFTNWMLYQGEPTLMLTADGAFHELHQWRKPPNIFRRGNQSNCLIRDRHWDLYRDSTPEDKATLELLADGVARSQLQ